MRFYCRRCRNYAYFFYVIELREIRADRLDYWVNLEIVLVFSFFVRNGRACVASYYNSFFSEYEHINLDKLKTRNKEHRLLQECIACGRDFVVDNTDPLPEDRKRYIDMALSAGYEITGYYFCSEIEKCILRNRGRDGSST